MIYKGYKLDENGANPVFLQDYAEEMVSVNGKLVPSGSKVPGDMLLSNIVWLPVPDGQDTRHYIPTKRMLVVSQGVTYLSDTFGQGDITLNHNGVQDANTVVDAWNAANPGNQVSIIAGDGSIIPDDGTVVFLQDSGAWRLILDAAMVASADAKDLAGVRAQLSSQYVEEVYQELMQRFGKRDHASLDADYKMWGSMIKDPAAYAGLSLKATRAAGGVAKDEELANAAMVTSYATACIADADSFFIWRAQRQNQYLIEVGDLTAV